MKSHQTRLLTRPQLLGLMLLTVALPLVYYAGARIDEKEYARLGLDLAQLREMDSLIDKELIASRYAMAASYDALEGAMGRLEKGAQLFENETTATTRPFANNWGTVRGAIARKRADIEDFKSSHAVFRNSLEYLPTAGEEALATLPDSDRTTRNQVRHLVTATQSFALNGEGEYYDQAHRAIDSLRKKAAATGERAPLSNLLSHADLIFAYHKTLDRHLQDATVTGADEALTRLARGYEAFHEEQRRHARLYRLALLGMAFLLVVVLFASFVRIRRGAGKLSETVEKLAFQKYALDQHAIVSIADARGDITYANEKFVEISGYELDELIGQNHRIIKSDEHPDAFYRGIWRTISKGAVWHGEIKNRNKKGGDYWVSSTIVPFLDAEGRPYQYVSIRTDITTRKAVEEESRRQGRFLAGLTDAMGEGVYALDREGRLIFLNAEAERMTGWRFDEVVGRPWLERVLPDRPSSPPSRLRSLGGRETFRSSDMSFSRRDGILFPVEVVSVPLIEEGVVTGSVTVFTDISDRKRAEREIFLAKEEAERANRAKSDFLANMSHEIRTPMNALIGISHLALRGEEDPQKIDYLTKIHSSARSLLRLINDILDFSKIEAGKMEIERFPFSLEEVLESVASVISLKAEEKGLELIFSVDPATPRLLVGDSLRLIQIVTNLAANAVKFTETGEVELRVEPMEENRGDLWLRFTLRDTGIGMDEASLDRLFESFSQADSSTTRRYGGTGLGLTISRRLADLMGGELTCRSALNEGSLFTLTLPFGHHDKEAARPHGAPLPSLEGMNVLLADDNRATRQALAETLASFTFAVEQVATGEEALMKAADVSPGLILLDDRMPGMSGAETARRLRELLADKTPPLLFLGTAEGERDRSIAKPVNPTLLYNAIVDIFSDTPGTTRPRLMDTTPPIQWKGKRALLAEDNPLNRQVVVELLRIVGIDVDVAENGEEAVNKALAQTYDILLMDVQMPVMDGYTATRMIRTATRNAARRLPIVAITAHAMVGDREKSLESGMDDHIAKPIDPDRFYDTIALWLGGDTKAGSSSPPTGESQPFPAVEGVDIGAGLHRCLGNVGFFALLLRNFAEHHARDIVALRERCAAGDRETAHRLAHSLKGSAGSIGAETLAEEAALVDNVITNGDPFPNLTPLATEFNRVMEGIRNAPLPPSEEV